MEGGVHAQDRDVRAVEGVDQGKAFPKGQKGRGRVGDGVVGVDQGEPKPLSLPLQHPRQGEGVEGPGEDGVEGEVHREEAHQASLGEAKGPFRGEEINLVPHPGEPAGELRGHDAATPKARIGHQP